MEGEEQYREPQQEEALGGEGTDERQIRSIALRTRVVFYLLFLVILIGLGKIVFLQYSAYGIELRQEEKSINYTVWTKPAKRGDIISSDGSVMVTTLPVYTIHMDTRANGLGDKEFEQGVGELGHCLSRLFGDRSAAGYEQMIRSARKKGVRYQKISPRPIDFQELQLLKSFPILREKPNNGGAIVTTLYERKSNGMLAQRTLGRSDENKGSMGIEEAFDQYLRGVDGQEWRQKISGNFWIPTGDKRDITPVDGMNVVTTIDAGVQDVAEKALKESLAKNKATWGTAILMEVETGEIKAIANLRRVERNGVESFVEDYNYAIGMNLEPGSTFKAVALMTLLDDMGVSIDEEFDTGRGAVYVNKVKVTDSDRNGHGKITLKEIFEVSSNIGFALAVDKYYRSNPKRYVDYINGIGFNEPYDFQIKGEAKPVIHNTDWELWSPSTLVTMSYGYGLLMTPMRTLTLYNAIANDGKLITPLLVKRVERPGGEVVKTFRSETINNRICAASTLRTIRESLEGVVYDGTGRTILLNKHYKIAGKTGTARINVDGRYETSEGRYYLGSFAGYFPADKPKYSCMVAVQTFVPFGVYRPYYGGTLAGPVFRKIADKVYSQAVDWGQEVEKPILDREERQKAAHMTDEEKSLRSKVIAEEQRVLPKIAVKGGS